MCNDQYNRMYNLHTHTAWGDVRNYENAARIKPESFKCIRSRDVLCALQSYFAYPRQVIADEDGYDEGVTVENWNSIRYVITL